MQTDQSERYRQGLKAKEVEGGKRKDGLMLWGRPDTAIYVKQWTCWKTDENASRSSSSPTVRGTCCWMLAGKQKKKIPFSLLFEYFRLFLTTTTTTTCLTALYPEWSVWTSTRNKCSAVAEMSDHLATIDMGRKVGRGCCAGIGEGRKPKQLQGTSTDVEWPMIPSPLITLEGKRWV